MSVTKRVIVIARSRLEYKSRSVKDKRTSITRVDGCHLFAPVEALRVVTGVAAVARFSEQEHDPALTEHAHVEDEQRLQ